MTAVFASFSMIGLRQREALNGIREIGVILLARYYAKYRWR